MSAASCGIFGKVEVVFGIWAGILFEEDYFFYDWHAATDYLAYKVSCTEPILVVGIMTHAHKMKC